MARPAAKRPTVATADDWYALAEQVAQRVDATPHGNRDEIYRKVAAEMGVSVHVPRRLVRAFRFLGYIASDIGDVGLARDLQTQPLTSVTVLARWANHSPDRVTSVARRLVDGHINLAAITAEEEADRKSGSRIAAATDRAWQQFATRRALDFVTSGHPEAQLVWSAKGWGVGGPRTERRPPQPFDELDFLPVLHLLFSRGQGERLLAVTILSSQEERPRMPTTIAQTILALSGYARLGCDCLLLCGVSEDHEVAERVLVQLRHAADVTAAFIELH